MSGDAHVRICESLGVQFPRATRLVVNGASASAARWAYLLIRSPAMVAVHAARLLRQGSP
jgi:hypothetical protein